MYPYGPVLLKTLQRLPWFSKIKSETLQPVYNFLSLTSHLPSCHTPMAMGPLRIFLTPAFAFRVPTVLTLSAHLAPASTPGLFWICQLPSLPHINTLGSCLWPDHSLITVVTRVYLFTGYLFHKTRDVGEGLGFIHLSVSSAQTLVSASPCWCHFFIEEMGRALHLFERSELSLNVQWLRTSLSESRA